MSDATPPRAVRRLRRVGEACLWTMVIAATALATLWAAGQLRIVVLPVALAVVLTTFLWPLTRRLRDFGLPRAGGVTIGLTVGGIIGALVAAPVVAVGATILGYVRERADAQMAPAEELPVEG